VALNAKAETLRSCAARSSAACGVECRLQRRKDLPAKLQLRDPVYEKVLSLQMMVHAAATPEIAAPDE